MDVCDVALSLDVIAFLYPVKNGASPIVALEGVGVEEAWTVTVDRDSAGPFPGDTLLVLAEHESLSEIALVEIKVGAVHRYQLWVQHCLGLILGVFEMVPVYEGALLRRMCVQIKVEI